MTDLYAPPDVSEAYEAWGANCGPCALAAILRKLVMSVRDLFDGFEARRYVNPTHMLAAIKAAGKRATTTPCHDWREGEKHRRGRQLPAYGLAFLQFSGGWWDTKPETVQYRFTHWVGCADPRPGIVMIYDLNAGEWVPREQWLVDLFPNLLAYNKCTGAWVRTAYEIEVNP